MRERIDDMVGYGSESIWVSTFHSTCVRILRRYIDRLGYDTNFTIYDADDQKALMKDICKRLEIDTKMYKEKMFLNVISSAKDEMIDPIEFENRFTGDFVKRKQALVYKEYQNALKQNNALDFDDLLVKTVELFKLDKEVLDYYQERFRYIMVDEYQDTNTVQFELIRLLAMKYKNLCVVGDDDQSIYRFRGARPELMLGFEKDYPDAERILLDVNYRCVDPVIESAGKLIANNKTRFQKEIHGNRGKGCPVFVKEWPDPLAETKAITEELRDYHQMGIAYEDMAVLYRTNQGPRLLIERMMEYNIPFHMRDTVPNLYEHWISRNVFCYIYAALGDLSRSNILQIINRPARYISRDALDTKVIRWEQLRSFYQDKNWMLDRIDQLGYDLEMLREMAPAGAVNYIRKAIGYDDYLREYANERRLKPEDLFEVLDALQESAVPFKTYEAWFNHMDEYKEQLKEQSALREAEKEGVSLMTMHSCKGLEFKVVYILDTNEGITPHHKAVLEPDLEEERRMFYVAMTRAKDRLHIFYVKERYHKRQTVSRFVVETGLLGKKGDLEKNGKQGRK